MQSGVPLCRSVTDMTVAAHSEAESLTQYSGAQLDKAQAQAQAGLRLVKLAIHAEAWQLQHS